MVGLKAFGRDSCIYAVGSVCLRASSFLLTPLYAYSLSLENFGLLSALLITIQIMLIVMSMGMRISLLRFLSEYEQKNKLDKLVGTTTVINTVGGLLVTVMSLTLILPFFSKVLHIENPREFVFLLCCAAFVQSLCMHFMSYYRAKDKAAKYTNVSLITAVILIILNLVFIVVFKLGVIGALLAYIVSYLLIFIYVLFDVVLKTGIKFSSKEAVRLFRFGCPIVFSMSGQFVIGGAAVYFLSYIGGLEKVAIYSLGSKLAQVLGISVCLPFQLAFQPFVYSNLQDPDLNNKISRLLTYLVFTLCSMCYLVLLVGYFILPIIAPPEYESAYLVLVLLLPGSASVGFYYFFETLLNAKEKTHINGVIMTIVSVLSIVSYFVLVSKINIYGAIATYNFSYFILVMLMALFSVKYFPIKIEWKRISPMMMAFAILWVLTAILESRGGLAVFSLFLVYAAIVGLFLRSTPLIYHDEKIYLRAVTEKLGLITRSLRRVN